MYRARLDAMTLVDGQHQPCLSVEGNRLNSYNSSGSIYLTLTLLSLSVLVNPCRWLGVDHVYLTDNGSKEFRAMSASLSAAFPQSFLTLRSDTYERAQLKVYSWCAETLRESYNWLAFFDLDEYLVMRGDDASENLDEPPNIRAFLDEYKHTAALAVNWVWVGPSGQRQRPAGGGVIKAYTQCIAQPDKHIKSIVNTWFLDGVSVHPHNFHYRCVTARLEAPRFLRAVYARVANAHLRSSVPPLLGKPRQPALLISPTNKSDSWSLTLEEKGFGFLTTFELT
jgi:hypothetical protein